MTTPFVLTTSHRVDPDRVEELRMVAAAYAAYVESNEPDLLAHYSRLDEGAQILTLVHVLADAAAADRHMTVASELIGKGVSLTKGNVHIDVLGTPGPVLTQALERNRTNGVQVGVSEDGLAGFVRG